LNPFTATTIATSTVLNSIYEGLFTLNRATGEVVPHLAERYEISEDKLTYTFYLRKGVLFHAVEGVKYESDDREFKTDDWLWAAKLSLSKDESISAHPEWMESVVGAADFKEGKTTEIEGVKIIDDHTFELRLTAPNRLFLHTLGVPAVSREAYEQLGPDFATHPVGTGPFMFTEWKRDNYLLITANPDYWREGYPKSSGVRFINIPDANTAALQYRQNELDFLFGFPTGQRTALVGEFSAEYREMPGLNVRYFGFKMDKGFFVEHPKVRQAFSHAFNRSLVWDDLMEGARFPALKGVLPPLMPASDPAIKYDYNLERAAELLKEAGFPEGEGMPPIKLFVFASAKDELSFPVLQDDLKKLGVELEIVVEDNTTYWDHVGTEEVLFFLSGWSAGQQDPADVFNFLFLDGRDDTKYNNPKVNDLLRAALSEFDPAARERIYQETHELIMADAPWIVSAYSKVAWLQKPWIGNFEPGGGGTYTADLAAVEIDTSKRP
ncbi:partial Glutathione-binding protein GsiB, partial [Anaerolineae bacterium]